MNAVSSRNERTPHTTAGQIWTDISDSLWEATANPRPLIGTLAEAQHADVVVIGMGYLGLACALKLAESGADVVVIDANGPGFGASGRNGGQVIPGLKYDPEELQELYGGRASEAVIDFVGGAADRVFDVIDRYGIACDPVRNGWIQGAHNESALGNVHRRANQWIARGVDADLLDARAVTAAVGCGENVYCGGWIDRRAGSVQPLNYALGLAEAALSRGARLFRDATATRIRSIGNLWEVNTSRGVSLRTAQVVIATNAYSDDLWPKLKTSIIPAQSFQVATDPLPTALRDVILPGQTVASDARRLLHYYRLDAAGHFVMGGRGSLSTPAGPAEFAHIVQAVKKTFPRLRDIPIRYAWAGRLAMTQDFLPHMHQPAGGITIALGCNGRGIALTTAVGEAIGEHLLRGAALPFPASAIRPIPFHDLHKAYVSLLVQYYKIRDMF
ncbi:FAD-binding oxidoreductase [Paraburkholderia nemoris]|uniref:NAD(P)/FAD-dependent oxidoreductase n=1 Tax=Paraburkholderia nemoris TaxID=2793076 RepID=UPI0038B89F46